MYIRSDVVIFGGLNWLVPIKVISVLPTKKNKILLQATHSPMLGQSRRRWQWRAHLGLSTWRRLLCWKIYELQPLNFTRNPLSWLWSIGTSSSKPNFFGGSVSNLEGVLEPGIILPAFFLGWDAQFLNAGSRITRLFNMAENIFLNRPKITFDVICSQHVNS